MADDRLGISVSGAGDVNGDGLADLIVGAPQIDDGEIKNVGGAYIIYGKAETQFGTLVRGHQVLDTAKLKSTDGFMILGDAAGKKLGEPQAISGAGDINGDGIDDLIVGAFSNDNGLNGILRRAGDAYIIYGKAGRSGTLDTTNLEAADGFIIEGEQREYWLGSSVSGAGDVNGDGLADLIVGAPGGDQAYIIYGKIVGGGTQFGVKSGNSQVLNTARLAPADGFILRDSILRDLRSSDVGFSVSGAGDINGDGLDDLIVGGRFSDKGGMNAGEAYIIYGKTGTGSQFGMPVEENKVTRQVLDISSDLTPEDGFMIRGGEEEGLLGASVSGAGDINGDGLADLIVGAASSDVDGDNDAGMAYILYGKAGTDGTQFGTKIGDHQVLNTTELAPTDGFILQGDAEVERLGASISGAGDINGDGFDDLIIGTPEGDDGGNAAGEAYVVYGGAHLGEVVTYDQTFTGGTKDLFLQGGAGNDTLEAHADTEVLYGGAGDDVLELLDTSFRRVDGGSGRRHLGARF